MVVFATQGFMHFAFVRDITISYYIYIYIYIYTQHSTHSQKYSNFCHGR